MARKKDEDCVDPKIDVTTKEGHIQILALIPEMKSDIKLIKTKLIDGNGEKGLITQHDILKTKFEGHLANHMTQTAARRWFIGILIASLLSVGTTLFGVLYQPKKEIVYVQVDDKHELVIDGTKSSK